MKLGLGTVQFGMDYGISNRKGRIPAEEAGEILRTAAAAGIRVIDTAAQYGSSEDVLGCALPPGHGFSIVTKTASFPGPRIAAEDVRMLERTFRRSLSRLRRPSVYGLLVHHVDNLFLPDGNALMEKMLEWKERGLVRKIGVSVYAREQIERVMDRYRIDLVQLPVNVLDQRMLAGGFLSGLKNLGIEIHARSLFLQGLLFIHPDSLPPHFSTVRDQLMGFHRTIHEMGMSPVQAALGFVLKREDVDCGIVGVCSATELREIVEAADRLPEGEVDFSGFACADERIVNPSLWQLDGR